MAVKNNRVLKIIGILFFTLFSILLILDVLNEVDFQRFPNIFAAYLNTVQNGYTSPQYKTFPLFDSSFTADSTLSPIAQRISETESFFPNIVIIHLIMVHITGITPEMSIIFPFGLVLVPIAYLGLLNSLLDRKKYPLAFLLLSIYGIMFLFTTKSTSSFYAATPGYTLLFIGIMCIWRYVTSHDIRYYFIIIILLVSLAHYWHTLLMTVMILLLCVWLVLYMIKAVSRVNPNLFQTTSPHELDENHLGKKYLQNIGTLAAISMVIAITFTHLWQSSYIDEFSQNANIINFIQEAFKKLTGNLTFEVPYQYNYKDSTIGMIYFLSYLSILALSIIMAVYTLCLSAVKDKRHMTQHIKINTHESVVLLSALMLAQLILVFLYYLSGSFNLFYVPLLFPMVAIYVYVNMDKNKKRIVGHSITASLAILIILSAICLFSIYSTDQAGETSVTKYTDGENSFYWTYSHIDGKSQKIYADFNILGKHLQYESKINKPSFNYEYITSHEYAALVGDEPVSNAMKGQFIIIDHATMNSGLPIQILDSRAALIPMLMEINYSSSAGKIYQDSHISIYRYGDTGLD
ncbi:hypothetical protein [Methanomassiliicoccus luminyensis]|nr:hypothetical protein [Methanomassiliicoccus luminyensis]